MFLGFGRFLGDVETSETAPSARSTERRQQLRQIASGLKVILLPSGGVSAIAEINV
jgi:hypothetical protein